MTVKEMKEVLELIANDDDEVIVNIRGKKYITEYVDRPTSGEFEIPVDLWDVVGDVTDIQIGRMNGKVEVTAWA